MRGWDGGEGRGSTWVVDAGLGWVGVGGGERWEG